jgi:hypothetical protein
MQTVGPLIIIGNARRALRALAAIAGDIAFANIADPSDPRFLGCGPVPAINPSSNVNAGIERSRSDPFQYTLADGRSAIAVASLSRDR